MKTEDWKQFSCGSSAATMVVRAARSASCRSSLWSARTLETTRARSLAGFVYEETRKLAGKDDVYSVNGDPHKLVAAMAAVQAQYVTDGPRRARDQSGSTRCSVSSHA